MESHSRAAFNKAGRVLDAANLDKIEFIKLKGRDHNIEKVRFRGVQIP